MIEVGGVEREWERETREGDIACLRGTDAVFGSTQVEPVTTG